MAKLTIKNRYRELRFFQRRLLSVIVLMTLMVLCLMTRLVYLQVVEKNLYSTLSKKNQLNLIPLAPKRGLIFDRNGMLLAENIPVFSLDVIPSKVKHLSQTIAALQQLIPISSEDIQVFYKELKQKRPFQPIPLEIKLTPKEVDKFSVHRWQFPGVMINARLMRYYPQGKALAQVVGFIGRINTEELKHVTSVNYSATNYIGKVGIEKYYEKMLHGKVGYQQVEIDASGRTVRVLKKTPPIAGNNIYLTIDSGLEKTAEKAFGKQDGAAVAIDPSTGEVLALVSHPSYNPNLFVRGMSAKQYYALQNSPNRPLYNRAIRGLYAPGSTIKPYYGLEGLSSGLITPNYSIDDPGYFDYGHHRYLNWLRSGFGEVDLQKALIVSDDTYFYNLAVKLGIRRIDNLLKAFGFGQATNIEMCGELQGVAPSPKWKQKYMGAPWYTGDTINMGIGQGYLLVTPLQMAQAVATIAEHGKRFQPHLLLKLKLPSGVSITQTPTPLKPVIMPKANWHVVIQAMQEVIQASDGVGWRFGRNTPYTVAAKTGTGQVYTVQLGSRYNEKDMLNEKDLPKKYRDNSLFIAFAPINHPKIAVAIVVEHNDIAPVIARKMMDYYLLTEPKLKLALNKHASKIPPISFPKAITSSVHPNKQREFSKWW